VRAPFLLTGTLLCAALWCTPGIAQDDMKWRKVDPANLVFIGMDEGEIVLELNPSFAPETVAQFRERVANGFYRGLSFYRVIDGFVAQAGDGSDLAEAQGDAGLPPEFERTWDEDLPWTRVQRDDPFAAETGFIDGFPAGRDGDRAWLLHCPGALAMARGTEPESGNTDFYIVIGQAPRYLDRNLTVFGRVIDGMETAQRIRRGELADNGIIDNDLARSRIGRMRLAIQLPEEERREFYVMDTNSEGFRELLDARRNRRDDFFVRRPPPVLDVCQVPVATRAEQFKPLSRRLDRDD